MSTWTVTISDAMNNSVLKTVENGIDTGSGEVAIRRFDPAIVAPPGAGKSLNLFVKQTVLEVPPRAIIQLSLDGTPVFWGPAVITPPLTAPGAGPRDDDRDALERVTVLGGEQLLKESMCGPRLLDNEALTDLGSSDVAAIALEFCTLYAHPALTVDYLNFPDTGAILNIFYQPMRTLDAALQAAAETVPGGASYWVDAVGAIHFEALS